MLTSILKQGAEFNSLADTALADRFNSMLELVARDTQDKGDFPIMMALTNAVPPENLVRSGRRDWGMLEGIGRGEKFGFGERLWGRRKEDEDLKH